MKRRVGTFAVRAAEGRTRFWFPSLPEALQSAKARASAWGGPIVVEKADASGCLRVDHARTARGAHRYRVTNHSAPWAQDTEHGARDAR